MSSKKEDIPLDNTGEYLQKYFVDLSLFFLKNGSAEIKSDNDSEDAERLREIGDKANKIFRTLCASAFSSWQAENKESYKFDRVPRGTDWRMGVNPRWYFWQQIRARDRMEESECIAIFCESIPDKEHKNLLPARIRLALEFEFDSKKKHKIGDIHQHNKFIYEIAKDIQNDLVCVVGSDDEKWIFDKEKGDNYKNNLINISDLTKEDLNKINDINFRQNYIGRQTNNSKNQPFKLQLSYIVELSDSNNRPYKFDVIKKYIEKGLSKLAPLYDSMKHIGENVIIYGAPGTGKSHKLERKYKDSLRNVTRVVFHPEYSYFDFIGTYKPTPVYKKINGGKTTYEYADTEFKKDGQCIGEPYIDYHFVPGPFTDVLVKALNNPLENYALLIEEINRADAAAVFGDVFQLLDRNEDGESSYGITPSREWAGYIRSKVKKIKESKDFTVKIPSNMDIFATMNSSDQNVNVLDTAFKRRWQLEFMPIQYARDFYIDINKEENAKIVKLLETPIKYGNDDIKWSDFIEATNMRLQEIGLPEDRMLGTFFVDLEKLSKYNMQLKEQEKKEDEHRDKYIEERAKKYIDQCAKKVLFYLWDDVMRTSDRNVLFSVADPLKKEDTNVTGDKSPAQLKTLKDVFDNYDKYDILMLKDNLSKIKEKNRAIE